MPEITKFQAMNGCSACKHADEKDPQGQSAASVGKAFWCKQLKKAVETREGAACPAWEC